MVLIVEPQPVPLRKDPDGTWRTAGGRVLGVTARAPTSGIAGAAVTLTGTGFTGTTAVDFTSAPGAAFTLIELPAASKRERRAFT